MSARRYRITAPVWHPQTGQGSAQTIEVSTSQGPRKARRFGVRRLRDQGWEVDSRRAVVREMVPIVGAGPPAERLRALREALGEDHATFAARFLVPAEATQLRRWEAGAPLRPFELQTLAYLEQAAFGRIRNG